MAIEEEMFADIPQEGDSAVEDDKQEETPAESQPEKEPSESETDDQPKEEPKEDEQTETEEPSQEGEEDESTEDTSDNTLDEKIPFHKHPRFKTMNKELKELREKLGDSKFSDDIAELKESVQNLNKPSEEIPKKFVHLFGDNKEAWENFRELVTEMNQEGLTAHQQKVEAAKEVEKQNQERSANFLKESFETLAEDTGLKNLLDEKDSTRNEILQIAIDYAPTDEQGNYSIAKSYKLWKQLNKQPVEKKTARKKIAAMTTDSKSSGGKEEDVWTPQNLKGRDSIHDM